MDRNPRCRFGDVRFAHPLRNILSIEQHPVAGECRLKLNARFVGQLQQILFIVERNVPLNRFQSQRAIHGAAFKIHVAEFARQP